MAPASSSTLLLFTVAFLAAHHVADGRNTIHDDDLVAKACTNASWYYSEKHMSQQFCESTLRSDKESKDAKVPGDLAVIALDLLEHAAADAAAKVAALKNIPAIYMEYCQVDYSILAQTIPSCRALVQEYGLIHDGKNVQDDDSYLYFWCADKLRNAANDCLEAISLATIDNKMPEDVAKQVEEVSRRATLAKAMVEQMVGEIDDPWLEK